MDPLSRYTSHKDIKGSDEIIKSIILITLISARNKMMGQSRKCIF